MKITCDIIKDLLPSYVDELLSEDGCKMVEEHLAECETCKTYYETLKGEDDILADEAVVLEDAHLEEMKPLAKIKKKMNRRTIIVSLVSAICAVAVLFAAYEILFHYDFYTPYEDAGLKVSESGQLYIEEDFYGTNCYEYGEEHMKFFFVTDTFVTQRTERSAQEKEEIKQDFSRTAEAMSENEGGEIIQKTEYVDKVYYPPKEYAEKLEDRYFMVSMNREEEKSFLEEVKAASVLIWERPKFVKGELDTIVSVQFTATVEAVVEDKNTGEGIPRYAVLKLFQAPPLLVDVGLEFGKELKVGQTYSFKMKDQFVALITETYDVETVISLYELELESISKPTEDQMGLDAVEIVYKKL